MTILNASPRVQVRQGKKTPQTANLKRVLKDGKLAIVEMVVPWEDVVAVEDDEVEYLGDPANKPWIKLDSDREESKKASKTLFAEVHNKTKEPKLPSCLHHVPPIRNAWNRKGALADKFPEMAEYLMKITRITNDAYSKAEEQKARAAKMFVDLFPKQQPSDSAKQSSETASSGSVAYGSFPGGGAKSRFQSAVDIQENLADLPDDAEISAEYRKTRSDMADLHQAVGGGHKFKPRQGVVNIFAALPRAGDGGGIFDNDSDDESVDSDDLLQWRRGSDYLDDNKEQRERIAQMTKRPRDMLKNRVARGTVTMNRQGKLLYIPPLPCELFGSPQEFMEMNQQEWKKAFQRFDPNHTGTIRGTQLDLLISYLGHKKPPNKVIDLCAEASYGSLTVDEFCKFMISVTEWENVQVSKVFFKDIKLLNAKKQVSRYVCERMLKQLGLDVNRGFMNDVYPLVSSEFDEISDIDFQGFGKFVESFRQTEGLSRAERKNLYLVFDKFVIDGSGLLSGARLMQVLTYMGHNVTKGQAENKIARLLEKVDVEKRGFLTFRQFLKVIRMVYDMEKGIYEHLVAVGDTDGNGVLDLDELRLLMLNMGYLVTIECETEICEKLGLGSAAELTPHEFRAYLHLFRECEGFTDDEKYEIRNAFQEVVKVQGNEEGELTATPIASLLRSFGYVVEEEMLHALVMQVDADFSGALDVHEVLKVFRMFRENEMKKWKDVFDEHCDSSDKKIVWQDMLNVLYSHGYNPTQAQFEDWILSADCTVESRIDTQQFIHIMQYVHRTVNFEYGATYTSYSFSVSQRDRYRTLFEKYAGKPADETKLSLLQCIRALTDFAVTEKLSPNEMRYVAKVALPKDESQQPNWIKFEKLCDVQMPYDFSGFLRMLTVLHQAFDRIRVRREHDAIHQADFELNEIIGLRS